MSRTVYVGNLNFKTTSDDLENFFEGAEIGNVTNVDLKIHPNDNHSKGWALVEFGTSVDAQSCAEQLNGALLQERILTIRLDRKSNATTTPNHHHHRNGGYGYNGYRNNNNNNNNNNNYHNNNNNYHNNNNNYHNNNNKYHNNNNNNNNNTLNVPKVPVSFPPNDRLFVGNLPWSVDNAILLSLFIQFNPTSATVVFGRDGRSRGYGIVELNSIEEATQAIAMNNTEYEGRMLNVHYDANQNAPTLQQKQAGAEGGKRSYDDTIFIGNLPWHITWQQLKDLFQEFSPEYVDVKLGPDGRSKGWGTVRFATTDIVEEAVLKFNGFELIGRNGPRNIEVRKDRGATKRRENEVTDDGGRSGGSGVVQSVEEQELLSSIQDLQLKV